MNYIEYLRQERRAGNLSSVLVKKALRYVTPETSILDIFGETFNFTPTDIFKIRRWDLTETSDEKIDHYMEQKFARRRLGGFLVPKNVAVFLGISVVQLTDILSGLDTENRIRQIGYPDPAEDYKKYVQDVELESDLLWELESLVQPPNKTPWWWWEDPPFDPFGGR